MEEHKKKKTTARYFNGDGSPATSSVGGSGGLKKKKKFNKPTHKKKDDGEEAIDIEEEVGGSGDVVDPSEISALVNKLGLNKFTPAVLSATSKAPKQRLSAEKGGTKGKKVPELDVRQQAKKKDNLKIPPKSNHTRFEEDIKKPEQQGKEKRPGKKGKSKQGGNKLTTPTNGPQAAAKVIAKSTGSKWYEGQEGSDDQKVESSSTGNHEQFFPSLPATELAQIQKTAFGLLENDVQAYRIANTTGNNKSDFQWMEKMMKSGTLPDRLAAYTVRIQDSPIHNLHFLQQLISMVKVQGKQQCLMTADTLRELFFQDLLPPDRKLVPFANRGAQLKTGTKRQLITWAFEDKLKVLYMSFVDAVKRMTADPVEKLRGKGIVTIYQLLVGLPEQEEMLLQILVNKLGDPAKKMASRALFYLKQLLDEHPRMKRVVVEEVERLLFRNNISKRAQYYGVCFLNLVDLRDEHPSLAHKMITVYVAFFKACVKTGDIETKMMSGLLTGINKAFPQAREFGFQFSENLNTLYKIVQLSQFKISIQALCILFQIVDVAANPAGADRFYRVLYEKLNCVEFKTSSHNAQLLNLLFKALKADTVINRVTGFAKRLLQICQNCAANLACAILFLLSEVAKVHPQCLRIGTCSTGELEAKQKPDEATDSSESEGEEEKQSKIKKTAAFEKFMKSTNVQGNTEVKKERKVVKSGIPTTIQASTEVIVVENGETPLDVKPPEEDVKLDMRRPLTEFDPHARNPCYSGAENSLAYELIALSNHFHPSVALFAQTLTKRQAVKYDGNPFRDFTLKRFLERFSYRNAKPINSTRPEYQPKGLRNLPVNSDNYLSVQEDKIPIEEKFFYRFFTTKPRKIKSEDKDEEDVSDTESLGDEEFDSLMKNYFKQTGGADGSDDDEDEDDDDDMNQDATKVDFASGLSMQKSKGKKRKQDDSESESDNENDEAEDDDDFDDDGDDFISMDDDGKLDMGESDDDDEMGIFEDDDEPQSFINKKQKMKKARKGGDMFAPAEEFSEMLEENADDVMTGSQTLINRDRADKKQLKWEMDRHRWPKGSNNSAKKGFNKKKFKRT